MYVDACEKRSINGSASANGQTANTSSGPHRKGDCPTLQTILYLGPLRLADTCCYVEVELFLAPLLPVIAQADRSIDYAAPDWHGLRESIGKALASPGRVHEDGTGRRRIGSDIQTLVNRQHGLPSETPQDRQQAKIRSPKAELPFANMPVHRLEVDVLIDGLLLTFRQAPFEAGAGEPCGAPVYHWDLRTTVRSEDWLKGAERSETVSRCVFDSIAKARAHRRPQSQGTLAKPSARIRHRVLASAGDYI